ncbi:MAG: PBP1A family penicillin-binding protein [Marinicaulis sp.]|nr:PBP1A family penicillin-binding protein [Marinicaulis sp.]
MNDSSDNSAPKQRNGIWEKTRGIVQSAATALSNTFNGEENTKPTKDPFAEDLKYRKEPGEGRAWRDFWGSILAALTSLAFLGASAVLAFAFVLVAPRVPDNADLWNVNRQSAIIVLDRNGEEIAARGARYGEEVQPEELPGYLLQAILSTEDRRFLEHGGVDLRGTLRAAMTNAKSGAVVEGGSTITQQLAKNLFLSPEQTYIRKLREALLALWLEGHYSKNEILSLYLNRIYLGAGAYGVESAAQTYFAKSARDITLAEAAMIAGLPKAPSTYAPTQNIKGAERRASEVLDNLLEVGAVTPFEAREARQNPASVVNQNTDSDLGYFFDYVAAKSRTLVENAPGDIIVTTTIDQKLQRDAEIAVKSGLTVDLRIKGGDQAALVAYDTTGALRAMVGGRAYKESQFNRAVQAKRQPGSAFKPFVYVAAMEAGMSPSTRFVDQPVDFEGWAPTNYTDNYRGPVRLTEAMAQSINTVAAQVSERVGPSKVAEAAMRFGVPDVPAFRAIALGAVDATLEELTGAYLPFARGGLKPMPYVIERIATRDDATLYLHENAEPERVMSARVAKNMNHLLYQVMHSGTGRRASLGRRPAAGKTGTTNDWRDAWFVGYTNQLVTGVWVGNDDYTPMEKVTGGSAPAEIWKNFMVAAHQGLPVQRLDGAYPAVSYAAEPIMLNFYSDVARGLQRVKRDGNPRRGRRRN